MRLFAMGTILIAIMASPFVLIAYWFGDAREPARPSAASALAERVNKSCQKGDVVLDWWAEDGLVNVRCGDPNHPYGMGYSVVVPR